MELPLALRTAIDEMLSGEKPEQLKKISKSITDRYKNESGQGKILVSRDLEARVYAAVRMPATFGAVCDALFYTKEMMNQNEDENIATDEDRVCTVFDIGAGSGAATWAADVVFGPSSIECFEREESMRQAGLELMKADGDLLSRTTWRDFDIEKDGFSGKKADLVLSSYVLNELSPSSRKAVIRKLWEATDKVLTIVEPGTKEGFAVIEETRDLLLSEGGHILAPCPHEDPCRIGKEDWCHFSCRVARSKLHKQIKDADVPYEDEKYSYISFSKTPCARASARVLRHPYITKGQVGLSICGRERNEELNVRKRDGSAFKAARKCKMGDAIEL